MIFITGFHEHRHSFVESLHPISSFGFGSGEQIAGLKLKDLTPCVKVPWDPEIGHAVKRLDYLAQTTQQPQTDDVRLVPDHTGKLRLQKLFRYPFVNQYSGRVLVYV